MQARLHELRADLQVVTATRIGHIGLGAPIGQGPVLCDRRRHVVERIAAGVVVHMVDSVKGIDRQYGLGAERVLIAGSEIER